MSRISFSSSILLAFNEIFLIQGNFFSIILFLPSPKFNFFFFLDLYLDVTHLLRSSTVLKLYFGVLFSSFCQKSPLVLPSSSSISPVWMLPFIFLCYLFHNNVFQLLLSLVPFYHEKFCFILLISSVICFVVFIFLLQSWSV